MVRLFKFGSAPAAERDSWRACIDPWSPLESLQLFGAQCDVSARRAGGMGLLIDAHSHIIQRLGITQRRMQVQIASRVCQHLPIQQSSSFRPLLARTQQGAFCCSFCKLCKHCTSVREASPAWDGDSEASCPCSSSGGLSEPGSSPGRGLPCGLLCAPFANANCFTWHA